MISTPESILLIVFHSGASKLIIIAFRKNQILSKNHKNDSLEKIKSQKQVLA